MAVIVQDFIPADCAGVCLAVDPVAEQAGRLVINAAWGLGAGVMDGRVPSDTYWLDAPALTPVKQQIATKSSQISPVAGEVAETAVPPEQWRILCLPPVWQERIAQFTLALTHRFGHPQELEWAVADGQLWILQSRPQTALPPQLAHVSPFPVTWEDEAWRDFWRLMEYSQGETPPLPLEHDSMRVRESIREETCRVMGVDKNMEMCVWNGRGYACRLPLAITAADRRVRRTAAAHLRRRLQQQGKTTWDHWGPEIVSAVERLRQFDRDTAAGPALADHLEETLAVQRRLNSLHPTVAALVTDPPPDVMDRLAVRPEAAEFRRAFSAFLADYGERTGDGYGSEASIYMPTWLEDPARPLRLAAPFLDPDVPAPAVVREQVRAQRDERVAALCAACEDETAVAEFRQQLAYARQAMVVLEDHNYWIEQAGGGQVRLAAQDILQEPDEIFWLMYDEITTALRTVALDAGLIASRQAQYGHWETLTPPPFLDVPQAALPPRPEMSPVAAEAEVDEINGRLRGLGASPGQVQGRVRVLAKAEAQVDIQPGDILVAVNAGPLWTPFFPILGGLILEEGSLGQHAAVTAREYGIPAVINVRYATRRLTDGEWVTVDGAAGIVIRAG